MTNTSIQIKKTTKEALINLQEEGESYNDTIERIIKGYNTTNDIEEISREKIAFTLDYVEFDDNGMIFKNVEKAITYEDIRKSEVGTVFKPVQSYAKNYGVQTAEIIWKDNNSALARLNIEKKVPEGHIKDMKLLHIHLL